MNNWPQLELDYTSFGILAVTPDHHPPQVLYNNYYTSYALRLSAPPFLRHFSSATFPSKRGKSASHVSRCLLHNLNDKNLAIHQCMHRCTTALQIMRWERSYSRCFPTFQDNSSRCTYLLPKVCVNFLPEPLLFFHSTTTSCRVATWPQVLTIASYRSMIVPTPLTKLLDIYFPIHVLRLPFCTYALKSIHYSTNAIPFKLYHFSTTVPRAWTIAYLKVGRHDQLSAWKFRHEPLTRCLSSSCRHL